MLFFERKFPAVLLLPLSWLYLAVISLRNLLYDWHILQIHSVDCPVICVGNIRAGGTGKTPTVMYLATLLRQHGKRVAVQSRGYGRKTKGFRLASDGNELHGSAEQVGDEPLLIARRCPGVVVAVDNDRVRGAKKLVNDFNPDVIVLDDGYQHRRLYRDINILTMRASSPWGNGFVLPAGPLRESKRQGLKRADLMWANGTGTIDLKTSPLVIRADYQPVSLSRADGEYPVHFIAGKSMVAFCGIAEPESFYQTLQKLDARLVECFSFLDHHFYSVEDLERIKKFVDKNHIEIVITTQKDWVKLPDAVKALEHWYALKVELVTDEKFDVFQSISHVFY